MNPTRLAAVLIVVCATAASAQDKPVEDPLIPAATKTDSDDEEGFRFNGRPSWRFGPLFRIDLRVKLQGDMREVDRPDVEARDGFEMNRRRIGIQGTFLRHFEYELEREIRRENVWRDVFVNVRYFDDYQVRVGKFKVPFSLEQLTGPTDLDFIYRSNAVNALSPARDIGVSVHGQFRQRMFGYDVGVFEQDGENARFGVNPGAGRTIAGRVTGRPLRSTALPGNASELTLGFAVTDGLVPEGRHSLRGQTAFRESFFDPVFVNGRRRRLGAEVDWQPGAFSVKGEFLRVTEERNGQGIEEEDLPPVVSRGWYISGSWLVTGESKYEGAMPAAPLFQGGAGALELALRYERLRFGSHFDGENESTSPRGANLLETGDRAWTMGVNWYINRWTKLQLNMVREWIEDAERSPVPDRNLFWTRVVRLQFVL